MKNAYLGLLTIIQILCICIVVLGFYSVAALIFELPAFLMEKPNDLIKLILSIAVNPVLYAILFMLIAETKKKERQEFLRYC